MEQKAREAETLTTVSKLDRGAACGSWLLCISKSAYKSTQLKISAWVLMVETNNSDASKQLYAQKVRTRKLDIPNPHLLHSRSVNLGQSSARLALRDHQVYPLARQQCLAVKVGIGEREGVEQSPSCLVQVLGASKAAQP